MIFLSKSKSKKLLRNTFLSRLFTEINCTKPVERKTFNEIKSSVEFEF